MAAEQLQARTAGPDAAIQAVQAIVANFGAQSSDPQLEKPLLDVVAMLGQIQQHRAARASEQAAHQAHAAAADLRAAEQQKELILPTT